MRQAGAPSILVTCEHGGTRVPREYRGLFEEEKEALASHRGWDPGALPLARRLSKVLRAPLRFATVSRLVVDLNRSARHPRVFSERTRPLPPAERRRLLERWHAPYRLAVDGDVRERLERGPVLHVGVHTFTPELHGKVRRADVALLYDPGRAAERRLAAAWAAALASGLPDLAVRRNQPYRGASDGLTTWLRGRHGVRYLGIELEVNQSLLDASGHVPPRVADGLAEGLRVALSGFGTV